MPAPSHPSHAQPEPPAPGALRFGDVAIRLGFINQKQLEVALELQRALERSREGRRQLIGVLLVELGVLTESQVIDVLNARDRLAGGPSSNLLVQTAHADSGPVIKVVVPVDPAAHEDDDTERVVLRGA